jgi:hypothetical protein
MPMGRHQLKFGADLRLPLRNNFMDVPGTRGSLNFDKIFTCQRNAAGEMVKRTTDVLPTLRLEFLDRTIDLRKVSVLPRQPEGTAGHRDGVLGMDALASGFTLDFRTMQLLLE